MFNFVSYATIFSRGRYHFLPWQTILFFREVREHYENQKNLIAFLAAGASTLFGPQVEVKQTDKLQQIAPAQSISKPIRSSSCACQQKKHKRPSNTRKTLPQSTSVQWSERRASVNSPSEPRSVLTSVSTISPSAEPALHYSSAPTPDDGIFVQTVRLFDNSYVNNSGPSQNNYSDYTSNCIPLFDAAQPQINVSAPQGNVYMAVFVDFNNDGDFTDPGEEILNQFDTNGGTGVGLGSFITSGMIVGKETVRVIVSDKAIDDPNSIPECGEVEDYSICEPCQGDVDGDGDVDWKDIHIVRQHVLGIEPMTLEQQHEADLDGNGVVTVFDILSMSTQGCFCAMGDIDFDGDVDEDDITALQNHVLGLVPLSIAAIERSDVNCSGSLTVQDILAIRKYILGLTSSLCDCEDCLGDVDGDGDVDWNDVTMVRKHVLGIIVMTAEQQLEADVNGNGIVSTLDYVLMQQQDCFAIWAISISTMMSMPTISRPFKTTSMESRFLFITALSPEPMLIAQGT